MKDERGKLRYTKGESIDDPSPGGTLRSVVDTPRTRTGTSVANPQRAGTMWRLVPQGDASRKPPSRKTKNKEQNRDYEHTQVHHVQVSLRIERIKIK